MRNCPALKGGRGTATGRRRHDRVPPPARRPSGHGRRGLHSGRQPRWSGAESSASRRGLGGWPARAAVATAGVTRSVRREPVSLASPAAKEVLATAAVAPRRKPNGDSSNDGTGSRFNGALAVSRNTSLCRRAPRSRWPRIRALFLPTTRPTRKQSSLHRSQYQTQQTGRCLECLQLDLLCRGN